MVWSAPLRQEAGDTVYISEVLERADALYVNQFSDSEKIGWLDELGAMLSEEYIKKYESFETKYSDSGITMPDGVEMSDIRRIYVRGIEIPKLSVLCEPMKGYILPLARSGDDVVIVYQKKYEPIGDTADTKTLCDTPYDNMYIEWLLLKMCLYSRDSDGYNQHAQVFNNTLLSYRNVMKNGAEIDKSARIGGWI